MNLEDNGRPTLTLNANYPPGAYERLDDGRRVRDHNQC
jgi:hypothetical protein